MARIEEAKATIQTYLRGKPSSLGHPDILMHGLPFKDRKTADALVENMKKAGLVDPQPEYVHASSEDQVTGTDLKALYYPSKIAGYSTTGLQWSQEFSEHGTVTFRAAGLPGGVDTGRSCQEGDRIWCQFKNYMSGVPYCRTTFKNPRGTHERKDEYLGFSDTQFIKFSRVR